MDFLLRLRPKKGIEPIRALRRALKYLLRGLRALSITEIPDEGMRAGAPSSADQTSE
jgi:hypothetical protein